MRTYEKSTKSQVEARISGDQERQEALKELVIGEECLVQVYHELSDQPVSQMDPWVEMQANLETLQDLQQRLSFALREVRYLLKA
jgi:hypothetical protein